MSKRRHIYIQLNKFPEWFSIWFGDNKRDNQIKEKIETLLQVQSPQEFLFEPYSEAFVRMLMSEPRMQFGQHTTVPHRLFNYLFKPPYRGDWLYLTTEIL